jgi:hypothetical protein
MGEMASLIRGIIETRRKLVYLATKEIRLPLLLSHGGTCSLVDCRLGFSLYYGRKVGSVVRLQVLFVVRLARSRGLGSL